MSTVQEKIELMLAKKEHLMQGGGEKSIAKQHSKGKLTARERLNLLFDEATRRSAWEPTRPGIAPRTPCVRRFPPATWPGKNCPARAL